MKQYIIVDWINNPVFGTLTFESFDEAWEYIYEKIEDEEMYQELEVKLYEDFKETRL